MSPQRRVCSWLVCAARAGTRHRQTETVDEHGNSAARSFTPRLAKNRGAVLRLVVGIGADYRGDDAARLHVARQLKALGLDGVIVYEDAVDALSLPADGNGLSIAVLVDAVRSGASPGTVFRFDARRRPIPELLFSRYSTHGLGVGGTIDLIRAIGCLPQRLIVYGIEGATFQLGQELSPVVAAACDVITRRIVRDLLRYAR